MRKNTKVEIIQSWSLDLILPLTFFPLVLGKLLLLHLFLSLIINSKNHKTQKEVFSRFSCFKHQLLTVQPIELITLTFILSQIVGLNNDLLKWLH